MHYGAIPIAFHVSFEALVGTAPGDFADLARGQRPGGKAMKGVPQGIHTRGVLGFAAA